MFVDRLLARFSIRTKVLIFVLPFIVSISAVGLLGLYASGLLQHRMEISNDTLQLLSGYRDVGSTMNQFLSNPGEGTRKAAEDQLKSQQTAMQAALEDLDTDAIGRADIEKAFAATKDIGAEVGQLWALYQTEVALSEAVNGNLKTLMLAQTDLADEAAKLQRAVRKDESEAKTALRDADKLTTSSKFLSSLASQATAAGAPERQFPFLQGKLAEVEKTQRTIASAMPKNQTKQADELAAVYTELRDRLATNDLGDANVQGVSALVRKFRRISEGLDQIAGIKSAGALDQFAKVDTKIVMAEDVLNGSRALISGAYELRIKTGDFLVSKDDETHQVVQRQIGLIGLVSTNLDKLGLTIGNREFFEKLYNDVTGSLDALTQNTGDLLAVSRQRAEAFGKASAAIDLSWNTLTQFADMQMSAAADERQKANMVSIVATALGVVIAIASGFALVLTLQRPIAEITRAMRGLAEGDNETAIHGDARADEIGAMSRALSVFRDNARAKVAMEAQTEQHRAAAEADRNRHDAEKREMDNQIDFAVSSLAQGLERLANGDVSQTIATPFVGRLEQLRQDFNRSLTRLQDTLGQIVQDVSHMRGNGQQMSQAADELSKRTEAQAASLEQTAAAVEEITVTVRSSADRARDANTIVMETRRHADNSVKVVADAISAMGRIESASSHIEQIIDVIEDIAFQTNLLALNAGIEAARAGEAGKGFAVVAQEVRELAQRSASAAQEIKDLINTSAKEVGAGAHLVQQTGEVLSTIGERITTISEHVQGIATASHDQAAALLEVNGAVNQMDQLTQQNAAMVEETSASSRQLAEDAERLMALVTQFRLARTEASMRRAA